MRKTLFFLILALAALVSCSKVDVSKSVKGTVWTGSVNDPGWKLDVTLSFGEATLTVSTKYDVTSGSDRETGTDVKHLTYTYDPPTIVATDMSYIYYGTVDGNSLDFNNSPGWGTGPTHYTLKN